MSDEIHVHVHIHDGARAGDGAAAVPEGAGRGEQSPAQAPQRQVVDLSDDDARDYRALDLATDLIQTIRQIRRLARRNGVRFDALVELVGAQRAVEMLQLARECVEQLEDDEDEGGDEDDTPSWAAVHPE